MFNKMVLKCDFLDKEKYDESIDLDEKIHTPLKEIVESSHINENTISNDIRDKLFDCKSVNVYKKWH